MSSSFIFKLKKWYQPCYCCDGYPPTLLRASSMIFGGARIKCMNCKQFENLVTSRNVQTSKHRTFNHSNWWIKKGSQRPKKREKGAIFYRPLRRFLCGPPIRPSGRYCFVCRFLFTLLSGRYCQRWVNANIPVVLNIEMRLGFWTSRDFLNQH